MRITYISGYYKPAYIYGGPVTSVSGILEALVKLGADVEVLTTNANGSQRLDVPVREPQSVNGVRVRYFPLSKLSRFLVFYSSELNKAITASISQAELVVIDSLFGFILGRAVNISQSANVPSVMPLHGQLLPWALGHHRIKKSIYLKLYGLRNINKITAIQCSNIDEFHAVKKMTLKPAMFVQPFGVDLQRYENMPQKGFLRKLFDIPESHRVILQLGRLHKVKRPEIAVAALSKMDYKDVHLVFAGPDEENMKSKLVQLAGQQKCSDRVHFTGLLDQDEVIHSLDDADLLFMPSIMESFGMAALEALAAGVPIVVSENIAVGYEAEKYGGGVIVSGGAESYANVASEILKDISRLEDMGKCGRKLIVDNYSLSSVAKRLFEEYLSIIKFGKPLNLIHPP